MILLLVMITTASKVNIETVRFGAETTAPAARRADDPSPMTFEALSSLALMR
jgi:hypothetical protein